VKKRPTLSLRVASPGAKAALPIPIYMQKLAILLCSICLFVAQNARANNYVPDILTDPVIANEADVDFSTGEIMAGSGSGHISLRSAVIAANNNSGADTITLGAGTYHLTIAGNVTTAGSGEGFTGDPLIGDLDIKDSDTTITGNGIGATTISQETPSGGSFDRIIEVNPDLTAGFNFTISDLTLNGGVTPDGGGAILAGSQNNAVTVLRVNFNHNTASGDGSAGGAIWFLGGGTLTVSESVFSNNTTTTSSGGAIDFFANPSPGSLTITQSTFRNNTSSGGGDGGAVRVTGDLSVNSSILDSAFTNNSVGGSGAQGGAISVQSSSQSLNIAFNRFYQNSAATAGNGFALSVSGSTSVTADQNWWGLNTGPGANDIFGLTPANWLQVRGIATDTTLAPGGSTSITADLLGLNTGGSISGASLNGLPAFPVSGSIFGATTLGNLSNAGTQFINGTSSATFIADGTAGFATVQINADGETITATIDIPTTVSSIARVSASPSPLSSVQWDVTLANPVNSLIAGNFNLVPGTGLGTAAITSVDPVGTAPTQVWRVTAIIATGDGTLGLDMVNDTGASADITNLPFTGEVYLIDRAPPSIVLSGPSVSATQSGPVVYDVDYADANFNSSTLGVGDITLNSTGTANGSIGVVVSGTHAQITISGITGDGTLGISIAAGTATDTAGNSAGPAGPGTTFIVDNTNDNPAISGTQAGQTVGDKFTIAPFTSVVITDPDLPAQALNVVVSLDDPAKGAFTTLNGFSDLGSGSYGFSGTAAAATAAIQGLVFRPAENRVSVGSTETIGFPINVRDSAGGSAADSTTTVISTSLNDSPVAGDFTITRQPGHQTKVAIAELLSHASDPDKNDTLTVSLPTATSANGATLTIEGGWALYTAPVSDAADTFSYRVTDGQGVTATATVTVNVQDDNTQSKNILSVTPDGNDFVIKFAGIPGTTYTIQSTEDLGSPSWEDRGTASAGANGLFEFRDVNPPSGSRFYRSHTP
jgi:hypothetical protein